MGPAGLLCLFVWTHTLFTPSGSSEAPVHQEFAPDFTSEPIRRHRRQYLTDEMLEDVIHRINDVEDKFTKSQKDVQEVLGYLKALGVSANDGHLPKSRDPCGNENGLEGSSEANWTRFGTSKCVKLMEKQSNFTNLIAVCREQYRIAKDIGRLVVVSLDSSQKAMALLETVSLQGTSVTSMWINQENASGSICTELRVPDTNLTTEGVDFKMVECGRLNSVVCEKPVIASFVEIVEQQFERNAETKTFEKQLKEAQEEIEHLRGISMKVGEWVLGGHRPFILQKAVGVWYHIEWFKRNSQDNPAFKCLEAEISLIGHNTIDYRERFQLDSSDEITKINVTVIVNTQSPHYWTYSGTYNYLWLKTDYDNWQIEGACKSNDISSCDYLHIYSRTRTLPSATLEMLRDAVEKFGFPKANHSHSHSIVYFSDK